MAVTTAAATATATAMEAIATTHAESMFPPERGICNLSETTPDAALTRSSPQPNLCSSPLHDAICDKRPATSSANWFAPLPALACAKRRLRNDTAFTPALRWTSSRCAFVRLPRFEGPPRRFGGPQKPQDEREAKHLWPPSPMSSFVGGGLRILLRF